MPTCKLCREPRITIIEGNGRERHDHAQLDSALSEILAIRQAQRQILGTPSTLLAAASLLPPCASALAPHCKLARHPSLIHHQDEVKTHRRPTLASLSPVLGSSEQGTEHSLPSLITTTLLRRSSQG